MLGPHIVAPLPLAFSMIEMRWSLSVRFTGSASLSRNAETSPPWGWVLFSLLSATGPSSLSESGSRHGSIGFDARRELGNPHQHFGAEAGCGFDDDAVFIAVHRSHAFIDIAEPDRVARICAAEGTPDLVRLDPDTIVFDRDHALGAGILRDDGDRADAGFGFKSVSYGVFDERLNRQEWHRHT